jgi:hypothetical protein
MPGEAGEGLLSALEDGQDVLPLGHIRSEGHCIDG